METKRRSDEDPTLILTVLAMAIMMAIAFDLPAIVAGVLR